MHDKLFTGATTDMARGNPGYQLSNILCCNVHTTDLCTNNVLDAVRDTVALLGRTRKVGGRGEVARKLKYLRTAVILPFESVSRNNVIHVG